jgi:GNAT superfamily N-acetyltransferase
MAVEIIPVDTPALEKRFIRFPWSVYRGDPVWVPPLLMDRKDFLNPQKNPFFEFAEVQLFLARKDGVDVGRIAAVDDPMYRRHQDGEAAIWGMFECQRDGEVAGALFESVEGWAAARDRKKIVGPFNLSLNHEAGLLVDGYDDSPCALMTYNPPWYGELVEGAGHRAIKDLWAWSIDLSQPLPEKVVAVSRRVEKRNNVRVRSVDLKKWDSEVHTVLELYNDCWIENWGFVPMSEKEFLHMAADLKMAIRWAPDLALVAEVDGRPVGFSLSVLDLNQAMKPLNGRLLPFGIIKLLLGIKKIDRTRLVLLGMREEFRGRGIDAVFYRETFERARALGARRGVQMRGEISWTLDDNDMVNRSIKLMGGRLYKTYRVYEKALA